MPVQSDTAREVACVAGVGGVGTGEAGKIADWLEASGGLYAKG